MSFFLNCHSYIDLTRKKCEKTIYKPIRVKLLFITSVTRKKQAFWHSIWNCRCIGKIKMVALQQIPMLIIYNKRNPGSLVDWNHRDDIGINSCD